MKKLSFLSAALLSASMLCLLTACPSPTGEVGPKGDKGDTGDQGPQGVAGPQGATGTANVIYSSWFTTTSWQTRTSLGNIRQFYYDKSAAGITASILTNGVVLVYGKLNGYVSTLDLNEKVIQLPYTVLYNSTSDEADFWSFRATAGNLRIVFENNKNSYTSISTAYQFRYIIIPGGVAGGRKAAIDYSNYEAVKRAYNLPD
ncbi:collagen-like triple helix repeat-containing protein [Runella sp.]|uniref:collagen-like triple helix repeat-containing protein n=1 Tax=Runella sp. TaxID=1960881 RepID=UPI003D0E3AF6